MQCKHTLITMWGNYQPIDLKNGKRRVKSLCKTLIDVYSPVRKLDLILCEERWRCAVCLRVYGGDMNLGSVNRMGGIRRVGK